MKCSGTGFLQNGTTSDKYNNLGLYWFYNYQLPGYPRYSLYMPYTWSFMPHIRNLLKKEKRKKINASHLDLLAPQQVKITKLCIVTINNLSYTLYTSPL